MTLPENLLAWTILDPTDINSIKIFIDARIPILKFEISLIRWSNIQFDSEPQGREPKGTFEKIEDTRN